MTKSTITREQLEKWVAQFDEDGGCDATDRQLEALIRQSLSALDSEPVAEVVSIYGDPEAFGEREIRPLVGIQKMPYGTKLYRHAQPVPVVSADLLHTAASAIEDLLTTKDRTGAYVWFDLPFRLRSAANAQPVTVVPDRMTAIVKDEAEYVEGWNACRAAMLQASPVCTCPSGDGSLRWPCPAHPGNSPVIGIDQASGPDRTVEVRYVAPPGYVMVPKEATEKMLIAGLEEANPLGSLIDWDASRGDCNTREQVQEIFKAMLAAAPQEDINALIPLVSQDEQEGK